MENYVGTFRQGDPLDLRLALGIEQAKLDFRGVSENSARFVPSRPMWRAADTVELPEAEQRNPSRASPCLRLSHNPDQRVVSDGHVRSLARTS
jgi:hypothetical protein